MPALSILIISLVILAIASYVDLRILEVPDWLNYSGIAAGLGIHLIFSAQQLNWWPIASSAIGFAIAFAFACIMYYSGQWGGGDAKLLMALGALVGFEVNKFGFGPSFLINLVFIGGAWGFIWSLGVSIRHGKTFWKTFLAVRRNYTRLRVIALVAAAALIIASFVLREFQLELLGLALLAYVLCYLTIFIKSVELCCMHKWITPDKLTEGDWLVHPVKVGKTKIAPARLGLEKKQVNMLKKLYARGKIKKVLVKYGIPFAPAFLITFIATIFFGNVILTLV